MFPCCYRFRKWKNFNQEPNMEKGHHRGITPNIIETVELLWQLRLLTSFSLPSVLETQNHCSDKIITFLPPRCYTFGAWCNEFRQTSFWYTYICSYNHIEHLLKTVIINEWIEMQLGGKHNMILHKKRCNKIWFQFEISENFKF